MKTTALFATLTIAASLLALPTTGQAANLSPQETSARAAADAASHDRSRFAGERERRARGNHQTNKGFINLSGNYVPKFNVTGRRTRSLLRY